MQKKTFIRSLIVIILVFSSLVLFCDEPQEYQRTIIVLKKFYNDKESGYLMYSQFSQKAYSEGYPRLGYLFSALKDSELINAGNSRDLLAGFGVQVKQVTRPKLRLSDTKTNLDNAIAMEAKDLNGTYPALSEKIKSEGQPEARHIIRNAWKVNRQHLDLLRSGRSFTALATSSSIKSIEEGAVKYFICQVCGSIVVNLPDTICPICSSSISNYKEQERTEQYRK